MSRRQRGLLAIAVVGLLGVGLGACGGQDVVEGEPTAPATASGEVGEAAAPGLEEEWTELNDEQRAYECAVRANSGAEKEAFLDEVCRAGESLPVESEQPLSLATAAWALALYEERVINQPRSMEELGADASVLDSVCSIPREEWVEPIVSRWRDDPTVLQPSVFVWDGVAYVPDEAFVHRTVSLQWQELCAPGEPL
jgi:hypothetical protein